MFFSCKGSQHKICPYSETVFGWGHIFCTCFFWGKSIYLVWKWTMMYSDYFQRGNLTCAYLVPRSHFALGWSDTSTKCKITTIDSVTSFVLKSISLCIKEFVPPSDLESPPCDSIWAVSIWPFSNYSAYTTP